MADLDDVRPAWLRCVDEGVVLAPYIGPADFLGRVIVGDVLTKQDFLTDWSPWITTFIHQGIVRRARWMAANG